MDNWLTVGVLHIWGDGHGANDGGGLAGEELQPVLEEVVVVPVGLLAADKAHFGSFLFLWNCVFPPHFPSGEGRLLLGLGDNYGRVWSKEKKKKKELQKKCKILDQIQERLQERLSLLHDTRERSWGLQSSTDCTLFICVDLKSYVWRWTLKFVCVDYCVVSLFLFL